MSEPSSTELVYNLFLWLPDVPKDLAQAVIFPTLDRGELVCIDIALTAMQ